MRGLLALFLVLVATSVPASAQRRVDGPAARMREFVAAVNADQVDSVSRFFPTRGDWTWSSVLHTLQGAFWTRHWRFAGADAPRALRLGGPACIAWESVYAGSVFSAGRPWEERGGRFIPARLRVPTFVAVEWVREGDTWVIARIESHTGYQPRMVGVPRGYAAREDPTPPRSLPLPPDLPDAAPFPWLEHHLQIRFEGGTYERHGLPLRMREGTVARIASIDGVGVYVKDPADPYPVHLFVPISPSGDLLPYQISGRRRCH